METEEEIAAANEELYGPAYSGVGVMGNDVRVMDSKAKKASAFGKTKKEKIKDGFGEIAVQVRRVTKVVKGVKQLKFRAIDMLVLVLRKLKRFLPPCKNQLLMLGERVLIYGENPN